MIFISACNRHKIFHTRICHHAQTANELLEKDRDELPDDYKMCKICDPTHSINQGPRPKTRIMEPEEAIKKCIADGKTLIAAQDAVHYQDIGETMGYECVASAQRLLMDKPNIKAIDAVHPETCQATKGWVIE